MPPIARRIAAALGDRGEEHIDDARIVALRRQITQAFIQPVRIASRKLWARADPEQREITEGRLADVREGREGRRHHESTDATRLRVRREPSGHIAFGKLTGSETVHRLVGLGLGCRNPNTVQLEKGERRDQGDSLVSIVERMVLRKPECECCGEFGKRGVRLIHRLVDASTERRFEKALVPQSVKPPMLRE